MPSFRLSEIELSTLPTPSVNGTERLMQVGGYRPQFRPHRGVIYLVQHGDQFLSRLSVVRGARVSDRHLLGEHTPMQPGAGGGGYQGLGWVSRVRPDHPGPQPSPV